MTAEHAHDHFDRYFAEKLWALIPEYYREQDGLAEPPGVLRGFIEVLAQQAATLRRSNDRLWDDQFIDLCADWAVPYIGELVATRMVSALARRARRVDVAKTIYYRRRAGTPRILEELIADITGWEGKLVEEFRRLGRTRHGLDPRPGPLAGVMTGTPPGGCADVRNVRGAELAGSPFDEFHHMPDVRRPRGRDGRYGIAKLGFHLYRLAATRLDDITPRPGPKPRTFTFDPSGRNIPLFIRRHRTDDRARTDWEQWISAREWELPSPVRCRTLNDAPLVITEQTLAVIRPLLMSAPTALSAANADKVIGFLRRFRDARIEGERWLWDVIDALPAVPASLRNKPRDPSVWNPLLVVALAEECGKRALLPIGVYAGNLNPSSDAEDTSDASVVVKTFRNDLVPQRWTAVARELVVGGNLANWTITIPGTAKNWVIDPHLGRLRWVGTGPAPQPRVSYHCGFSGDIGAGGYNRSASLKDAVTATIQSGGKIQTTNSSNPNFLPAGGANGDVAEIIDSANYTPIDNRNQITRLTVRAADRQRPYIRLTHDWRLDTSANADSELKLNGLWIGADGVFSVRLIGDYKQVTLRNVTLDPGGTDADGNAIRPVPLVVQGNVARLVIENSIVGPIQVTAAGELTDLEISDSIVDGLQSPVPAIAVPAGRVTLHRVTVLGEIAVEWLDASEVLITEYAAVTNTQEGCFRFSAVRERRDPKVDPATPHSRVPHPYESHFVKDFAGVFTSQIFGDPGYLQLAESAPVFLRRGAENRSEIGAFSALLNPIKFDSLEAKVEEFAPFGLLPVYIFET
jgi:hypothetical protein